MTNGIQQFQKSKSEQIEAPMSLSNHNLKITLWTLTYEQKRKLKENNKQNFGQSWSLNRTQGFHLTSNKGIALCKVWSIFSDNIIWSTRAINWVNGTEAIFQFSAIAHCIAIQIEWIHFERGLEVSGRLWNKRQFMCLSHGSASQFIYQLQGFLPGRL